MQEYHNYNGAVYLHRDFLGSDRIILHPRGMDGRRDSGPTEDEERAAIDAAAKIIKDRQEITNEDTLHVLRKRSPQCEKLTVHFGLVIHLNPHTLGFIEAYPVQ